MCLDLPTTNHNYNNSLTCVDVCLDVPRLDADAGSKTTETTEHFRAATSQKSASVPPTSTLSALKHMPRTLVPLAVVLLARGGDAYPSYLSCCTQLEVNGQAIMGKTPLASSRDVLVNEEGNVLQPVPGNEEFAPNALINVGLSDMGSNRAQFRVTGATFQAGDGNCASTSTSCYRCRLHASRVCTARHPEPANPLPTPHPALCAAPTARQAFACQAPARS